MDFKPTMNVIEPSVCGMCALSDYQRSSLIYGVTRKELGGSHAPQICTTSKDFHVHHIHVPLGTYKVKLISGIHQKLPVNLWVHA